MHVLRPIREDDLPGLVALAASTGGGLTTLPPDKDFLAERIHESLRAFSPRVRKPRGECYLFVLEDTREGGLAGVSGIVSRVGGFEPWYSYEIRREKFAHKPLKVGKEIPVLSLRKEHNGPSEICSLFLRKEHRRGGAESGRGGAAGRLLSLGRFLFMGTWPQRFTEAVIAEMRGYIDDAGKSPFWEAVGRNFFEFDYYAADVLSGLGEKEFIADLMPRHPIYIPMLAPEVQAVIGRVHRETEPALALLLAEGFARTEEVDIFDAGPLVRATVAEVRTVRTARTGRIRSAAATVPSSAPVMLLSNGALDFRACTGAVLEHPDGQVSLSRACAEALNAEAGEKLTWALLK